MLNPEKIPSNLNDDYVDRRKEKKALIKNSQFNQWINVNRFVQKSFLTSSFFTLSMSACVGWS
jgi:hypothetical protein